jgi:hypothetical protein
MKLNAKVYKLCGACGHYVHIYNWLHHGKICHGPYGLSKEPHAARRQS